MGRPMWSGFFFFSSRRRHTRFDCDWSSDVCSSDLSNPHSWLGALTLTRPLTSPGNETICTASGPLKARNGRARTRSEERRVGKECRARWAPDHYEKNDAIDACVTVIEMTAVGWPLG